MLKRFAYVLCGLSLLATTACGDDGGSDNNENGEDNGDTGTYTLEVTDQVAGDAPDEVTIPSVETGNKDAWVVIHEKNDAGDAPGDVIGTSEVISADSEESDLAISLDREAESGETLYAMLHYDDPADGEFTFGEGDGQDLPVKVDGEVLTKSFKITTESDDSNYSLQVSDQTDVETPGDVVIDSVQSGDQPVWIVIHEQNEAGDSFGSVIGNSELIEANSEQTDVTVELDRDFEQGETLYAMLHYDDPADGEYTFGETDGEDAPVTVDGDVLVKSFTIGVMTEPSPSLSVSDQETSNASEVTVDSVQAGSTDTWVVIHEENEAGDGFGDVIGHSELISAASQKSDVTVTLDRQLDSEGETLYAMLHADDPADGEYTFGETDGEDPPVTKDGSVVVKSFNVTVNDSSSGSNYSISVSDQSPDSANEVTIDNFSLGDQDAFIVIHEQNEAGDSWGSVIGNSSVISAGTNTNDTVVSVDRALEDGETLYAMLHYDDPADGEYTFGENDGEDPPVTVDGDVVVDSFTVSLDTASTGN
jgi:hypothetical protein